MKLVVQEAESAALHAAVRGRRLASCGLARVEVPRAVRRQQADAISAARELVRGVPLVLLTDEVLSAASRLPPPALRSLDAIHVAAALTLGDALDAVITYDDRMADAARAVGLEVRAPG